MLCKWWRKRNFCTSSGTQKIRLTCWLSNSYFSKQHFHEHSHLQRCGMCWDYRTILWFQTSIEIYMYFQKLFAWWMNKFRFVNCLTCGHYLSTSDRLERAPSFGWLSIHQMKSWPSLKCTNYDSDQKPLFLQLFFSWSSSIETAWTERSYFLFSNVHL